MTNHILFAVTGITANVIAECFYALAVEKKLSVKTVVAVTTEPGERVLTQGKPDVGILPLLGKNGVIQRICNEYNLPEPEHRVVCPRDSSGQPVPDVFKSDQITAVGNALTKELGRWVSDEQTSLHCVYAGGRRVMAMLMGITLSMRGRAQDELSYVEIYPSELLNDPTFFYPSRTNPQHAAGHVILHRIPLPKLGQKYKELSSVDQSYSGIVDSLNKAILEQRRPVRRGIPQGRKYILDDPKLQKELRRLESWAALTETEDIPTNILVYGETGTGKEIIARHYCTKCSEHNKIEKDKLRVANCAGFDATRIGPELFGIGKGKFTGVSEGPGMIEESENGVLFLDEFHHLDRALQARLLRFLEYRETSRMGDPKAKKVKNVHVLLGTNQKPETLMEKKILREDIYYRINKWRINVPPLRERNDFEDLAYHFLAQSSRFYGKRVTRIAPSLMIELKTYPWPGNLRELSSAIDNAVQELDETADTLHELDSEFAITVVEPETAGNDRNELEPKGRNGLHVIKRKPTREILISAMKKHHENKTAAARELGISVDTLVKYLRQFKLMPPKKRW